MNFIPFGWKDGNLPLTVVNSFEIEGRKIVVAEYGYMYGAFDYATGAKFCDMNFTYYMGHTHAEYISEVSNMARRVIEVNSNWLEILSNLPIINN